MPDITAVLLAILVLLFAVGVVLGWLLRSDRCAREKIAINAGWQEQMEGRQAENGRLEELNKNLMQHNGQYQASQNNSRRRAEELSGSLKDAVARRNELHRQIKDIRSNLEDALERRNRLQTDIESRDVQREATLNALRDKDNKIFKLSRELNSWQTRVPPLVEKFRQRDRKATELEAELERARDRIIELESPADQTRIEPVDRNSLADGLDASNDQYNETSEHDLLDLQDQVAHDSYGPPQGNDGQGIFGNEFFGHSLDDPALSGRDNFSGVRLPRGPELSSSGRFTAAAERDDLKLIKGVGPAIERILHELGIFRFDQIARISEYDIDRIAEHLKGFRSRIYRENWIGQANTLQYEKDSDPA